MKKPILQPMIADESVIVQFTDTVVFDKAIAVTVPNGYTAYVFSDEKAQFRIEPYSEKKIVSYGKELLGKNGRIAFVRTKPLPPMAWGFGNIQVNNERLKEAYRVGANGKYAAELSQPKNDCLLSCGRGYNRRRAAGAHNFGCQNDRSFAVGYIFCRNGNIGI